MNDDLKILRLKGKEIIPFISELAKLRIHIFKEYPYLYDGDMEYEKKYLNTYVKCPESILILVLDHDQVVGASSAIPLEFETIEFRQPFLDHHINTKEVFYFGESLLRHEYRGRHIYRQFFTQRESAAKEYGSKTVAFATIQRADNDARKPKAYFPLDDVWKRLGYKKHIELCAHFKWKEVGEQVETSKPMVFWLKQL